MLLFHEVCHSSKIYLLIEGLKLENGILKEVGSNESDVFACFSEIGESNDKSQLAKYLQNSYAFESYGG